MAKQQVPPTQLPSDPTLRDKIRDKLIEGIQKAIDKLQEILADLKPHPEHPIVLPPLEEAIPKLDGVIEDLEAAKPA